MPERGLSSAVTATGLSIGVRHAAWSSTCCRPMRSERRSSRPRNEMRCRAGAVQRLHWIDGLGLYAMTVRIQREDFDIGGEIAQLTQGRTDIGAVATFTGICRDDGIKAMTLEHYPGMAEAEIARHVEEEQPPWPAYSRREHRAGDHRLVAPRGGIRGRRVPDGLSKNARTVLEERRTRGWDRLGGGTANRRSRGGPLDGRRQQTRSCRITKDRRKAGGNGGDRHDPHRCGIRCVRALLLGRNES